MRTVTRDKVIVERSAEVRLPLDRAWARLADVERWPEWAPHIRRAALEPPGPAGPTTSGVFWFRPTTRARFRMTNWEPGVCWTWTGRATGVLIDYAHLFEAVSANVTRLRWTVSVRRTGVRARIFATVYGRLVDRAMPGFVAWAEAADAPD